MSELSDYRLTLLRAGHPARYRAVAMGSSPVLFCVSDAPDSGSDGNLRLHREYSLRTALSADWAVQPVALLHREDKLVLMLEDPGGSLLAEACVAPLPVGRFLALAVAIASAVNAAHTAGFVHCDLGPHTIWLLEGERAAQLTGFGCAIARDLPGQASDTAFAYQGDLGYMAPELCGRMKLDVDFRADLYSLGCVFYQMLTGEPPTTGPDGLAMAHAHQARKPAFPQERVAGIPRPVEAIVMKLLEKDPSDRYQSAASLRSDLHRCLAYLERGAVITPFPLDLPAISARQRRPRTLFGRDAELAALDACFAQTADSGPVRTVFVSGYSGSGKSSLVRHWSDRCATSHLFVAGVCEQVNSAMPYAALVQILDKLVSPMVGASEATFLAVQARLRSALGNGAHALWSVIPDLRVVLGATAARDEPFQAVDRPLFLRMTTALVEAFATPDAPLVLFFDDLQWADEGTLSALGYLCAHLNSPYVLLLGAWRSNEVGVDHPLRAVIDPQLPHCTMIDLAPLGQADTAQLVAATLGCTLDEASPIVELVREKTGGNPFFTTQFSIELAQEGLVDFEHQTTLLVHDIDRIRAKAYSDNVVDLILRRLDRLPAAVQTALRQFACMGSATAASLLARAAGVAETDLAAFLAPAVRNDLIFSSGAVWHFRHDRIRESAYASIDTAARNALHLQIARRLLTEHHDGERYDDLFEIACQINFCFDEPDAHADRERYAQLNVAAGKQAREATAYASALTYFVAAARWLEHQPDSDAAQWIEYYRADCECLIGDLGPAQARLEALTVCDISMPLRAEMTRLASGLYTAQSRPDLGMNAGIDYLRRLGIDIPIRPTDDHVAAAYAQLCNQLGTRPVDSLIDLPVIDDPVWHSAIAILADLIPPALFIDVNLLDTILIEVSSLSLRYGLCDASAFGFVFLNFVFGIRFGDYERGYAFGKLAVTLVDRYERSVYKSRIYMRFGSLVVPWTRHWREGLPYIESAYRISSEVGSMVFNVSSARNVAGILMLAGAPLDDVRKEARKGFEISIASNFALYAGLLGEQVRFVDALSESGLAREPDEEHDLARGTSVAFTIGYCRLARRFLLGDLAGALEASRIAADSLLAAKTIVEVVDYHFYSALVYAAGLAQTRDAPERDGHQQALAGHLAELAHYAHHCPANFAGRHALVMARQAELNADFVQADTLYQEAIDHARTHRFLQIGAMANELAAASWTARGDDARAKRHAREAIAAYTTWGALAKVRQLHAQSNPRDSAGARPRFDRDATVPLQQLDVAAVMKASHALMSEIKLDRLIETLVTTALEHAGASRCVLLSTAAGEIHVEAQARVSDNAIDVDTATQPLSSSILPVAIVQAVSRSAHPIVLDDASMAGAFVNDPFVQRYRSRAIACTPLLKQGTLVAILYLENDLAAGAFTDAKMSMLGLLGGQAAIALENARLYQDLIEENRRRAEAEAALRNALANLAQVTRLTTMGELVASIIHEVTQPVTAITTSASAALRFLSREPDTPNVLEAKDMIRLMMDDGARAGQVIRGLRAMARKAEPTFEAFDLHQTIDEILALLRGQINDFNVELDNQLSGSAIVHGDRVQVQQVALNLVVNAVEAMGTTRDAPRQLTIATDTVTPGFARVTVTDTGPGIAPAIADRVFDPFVTTKGSGMGMGLSICRSIIEAHGGVLSTRANATRGTTFFFTLPLATKQD